MGSSNMIELRDLVGKAQRVYTPSRFLSPQQIMMAARAPRLRPSYNGAFVDQRPGYSNNEYTGIMGGSSMQALNGDIETYYHMAGLTIDQAYENQQRALAQAQQAQAERDAYAAKVKLAQQQVIDMQKQVQASKEAQDAQNEAARQEMMKTAAQLDTSTRMLAYKQQQKLEEMRRKFNQDAVQQQAAQAVRNQALDAANWQQRQQDEILAHAQRMAALQNAAGMPTSPASLMPVPAAAQPTLMPPISAVPSQNLAPEGGHPVVDFGAAPIGFNPNPDAAGSTAGISWTAPNWNPNAGGSLISESDGGGSYDQGASEGLFEEYNEDMSDISTGRRIPGLGHPVVTIGAAALLLLWALKK